MILHAFIVYGMGNEVSLLGDVYSFGILLLEIFIGKHPIDSLFNDGLTLHEFAKMALPERAMEIVEPSLLVEARTGNNSVETSVRRQHGDGRDRIEECLVGVLRIGVVCSLESPCVGCCRRPRDLHLQISLRHKPSLQRKQILPLPTHQSPSKPTHASTKLPEKYRQLCKFFNSLDSAIRLLKLKRSMSTFTNISPKIECLTDRRFSYCDLAQLKFLLPEAIEIKKVLMFDEKRRLVA
ncbi:hypothetical protein LWI29_026516 [Acer saccharum]|uniref:CDT1 Geminin-binding domain-containing protein n=1 Tax=Acer saccharum TaxID=4024 RepID=A0AA39SLV0_ACESA|nr:hypothetical protein LWI29_026516 [Acer saccharum]